MRWLRRWDRWSRRAATAFVAAALGLVAALAAAVHVTPPRAEGTASAAAAPELPPAPDSSGARARAAIRTAVASDPFREQRRPAERRYVLPANRSDDRGDRRPARGRRLRLVGTATFADREGVAAFRLEDGRPRVAGPGAQVGGLEVVSVEEGRVVLSGPDTTLVLRVDPSDDERP